MSVKDPKSQEHFSKQTRDTLSKGTVFELPCGGRIKFMKTKRAREPDGRVSHVAKFDVIRESQGEQTFVFGPTYTTTEYLALCNIEAGDWIVC